MKKIMLMARDPGGANTIIPLVSALQEKGHTVMLLGKDAALARYRQFELEGVDITELIPIIEPESWREFLIQEKPDFIITGTSGDDFTERYLWQAASLCGIRTFAILDQWINYGIRFSSYRPSELSQYQQCRSHPYMPNYILVMDEEAKGRIVMEGIPADRVLISGQPYFDLLLKQNMRVNQDQLGQYRQQMGINMEDYLISFISEPLSDDYSRDKDEPYWGYDEKSICVQIIEAISMIAAMGERRIHFLIKQHPRESSQNYRDILDKFTGGPIKLKVEKEIASWPLLLVSDLVCGISSMLLLEAILLGRPVISVQIGLKRDNPLILDQRGILRLILQPYELEQCLGKILLDQEQPIVDWPIEVGAVENVINYMEELLCQY